MQLKWPWGPWPKRVNNATDQPLGGAVAVNGILQHWSSCREWGRETETGRPGDPRFRTNFRGLRRTGWAARALSSVCDWRRKTESKNYQPGNEETSRVSGGSDISSGGWKERERERKKISVNLTKRLRTASILRDCAHVTGCVFWDGCFILCLLRCCISCSWSTSPLVKQQQLGLRTKKSSAGTRNFFSLLWKDLHKHARILSVARCWHAILFLVRCWILGIGNSFGRIPVWIRPMSSLFICGSWTSLSAPSL